MNKKIEKIKLENFLAFQGEFDLEFCPGINVFIGGNATGKTTLLKVLYAACAGNKKEKTLNKIFTNTFIGSEAAYNISVVIDKVDYKTIKTQHRFEDSKDPEIKASYIPEKDMLEHAKGLLDFIDKKETGFGLVYKDALISGQAAPDKKQSPMQKSIGEKISKLIGGSVEWSGNDGAFYTVRSDKSRIPFATEASGFKKMGFLGLLLTGGRFEGDSVLFWDEPENSLNPELIPSLVEILFELQSNGVQVFIATHSELLAKEFSINSKSKKSLCFYSLTKKSSGGILAQSGEDFDLLVPNKLKQASVDQYRRELARGLGDGK